MHTYTGCASAVLGHFYDALSYFERAFSWFTTGDFSDPGMLRVLMICAAQSTFDYFKDSKDFFTLIQYAAKVSKVFAASRAPEHFGVHLSEKTALPKAINMHMDRYNLESENLSEVNKVSSVSALHQTKRSSRHFSDGTLASRAKNFH